MPSSLFAPIPIFQVNIDRLPPYTSADPETSSVHSSAPSYVSETPTYHSTVPEAHSHVESGPSLRSPQSLGPQPPPPSHQECIPCPQRDLETSGSTQSPPRSLSLHPPQRLGLPPVTYAPGFRRLTQQSSGSASPSILNLNVNELRSIYTGPKAQVYRNITARRARKASAGDRLEIVTLMPLSTYSSSSPPSSISPSFALRQPLSDHPNPAHYPSRNLEASIDSGPTSPNEDPELVGAEAATLARERRIYIAKCLEDREALKTESLSWDFMLGQMTDWKERERNWQRFQGQVQQRTRITNGWKKRRK